MATVGRLLGFTALCYVVFRVGRTVVLVNARQPPQQAQSPPYAVASSSLGSLQEILPVQQNQPPIQWHPRTQNRKKLVYNWQSRTPPHLDRVLRDVDNDDSDDASDESDSNSTNDAFSDVNYSGNSSDAILPYYYGNDTNNATGGSADSSLLPTVLDLFEQVLQMQTSNVRRLDDMRDTLENFSRMADALDEAYELLMGDADNSACDVDEHAVGVDSKRRCYYLDGLSSQATYQEALNNCSSRRVGSFLVRATDGAVLQRIVNSYALLPPQTNGTSMAIWLLTANTKGPSTSKFRNNGAPFGGNCSVFDLSQPGVQLSVPCSSQANGFVCYREAAGKVTLPESLYNLMHNVKSNMRWNDQ